jgi:Ca2+-binding RTX toxin-like protein
LSLGASPSVSGVEVLNMAGRSLIVGAGTLDLSGIRSVLNAATIQGNNAAKAITGTQAADTIGGGDSNDNVTGAGGKDRLFGQSGNDVLLGGDGVRQDEVCRTDLPVFKGLRSR